MESASRSASLSQPALGGAWPSGTFDPTSPHPVVAVLEEAQRRTGATTALAYRLDPESDGVVLVASAGRSGASSPPWFPSGVGLVGLCQTTGVVVRCDDMLADPRVAYPSLAWLVGRSTMFVPFLIDGQFVGVLFLGHV